ncbi:MAG: DUF4440 domain-containing protein [Planctomycetota bacterium]
MTPAEFMDEYAAASRAQDLERVMSLIDDDAVYWFSTSDAHVGKVAIAEAIGANFEAIEGDDYQLHDVVWVVETEDCAVCTYRYTWAGVIGGQPASGEGRGTSVLKRRGESWFVAHEHLSPGSAS